MRWKIWFCLRVALFTGLHLYVASICMAAFVLADGKTYWGDIAISPPSMGDAGMWGAAVGNLPFIVPFANSFLVALFLTWLYDRCKKSAGLSALLVRYGLMSVAFSAAVLIYLATILISGFRNPNAPYDFLRTVESILSGVSAPGRIVFDGLFRYWLPRRTMTVVVLYSLPWGLSLALAFYSVLFTVKRMGGFISASLAPHFGRRDDGVTSGTKESEGKSEGNSRDSGIQA